jgi:hypothetical protein
LHPNLLFQQAYAFTEAERALARMRMLLAPLGLELNSEKTRICRIEDGVEFLGAGFGGEAERAKFVRAVKRRE